MRWILNFEHAEAFKTLKQSVLDLDAERRVLNSEIQTSETLFECLKARNEDAIKARKFLQQVAKEVQKNLENKISDLVSLALMVVFKEDAPKFVCEFVERRNVMECDLYFDIDGKKQHPIHGGGGGPTDVADFALRVAYWSLHKNRPVFVLDEPFKFVSHDLQPYVSDMLEMLCEKVKLQIIMVSHQMGVNIKANNTIEVDKINGISKANVEKNVIT